MFKDYDKYLSTSLKVYLFVLTIIFIMKLVGLDYFGLELTNPIMIKLGKLSSNIYIKDIIYFLLLITYQYLMISAVCKDNSKSFKIFTLITCPITYIVQFIKNRFLKFQILTTIGELIYLYLIAYIFNKRNNNISIKTLTKRYSIIMLLNMIFQIISMITRYKYNIDYINEFIPNIILNLDYLLLLLITQKLVISRKGVENKCYQEVVGSSLPKKLNLKTLLRKLQKNWHNFKKQDKVTKLTYIIYFIFSFIWNIFCIITVLFVAMVNDTFIECIFILTSFWLSKKSFGKAFHFSSMAKCFIVSNLSYYILNRITTPLGISIIVPILLGVGLSYVTSKLVKKTYKTLYRGMPEELFEETILKVVDKNSLKYMICYDFYIKKKSIVSLSIKYNYTESGIRKIKERVNDKIKRLN